MEPEAAGQRSFLVLLLPPGFLGVVEAGSVPQFPQGHLPRVQWGRDSEGNQMQTLSRTS